MNILICGANGFVGHALCTRLKHEGHRVLRGVRHAAVNEIHIDYASDRRVEQWSARLRGVDAVINAVGILTERGSQTFDAIHRDAPIALFEACHLLGIKRIVQISVLGCEDGDTAYFRSKREADAFLMTLPIGFDVVRPALVYGASGTSARLFRTLASLPVHVLPGDGDQVFRPVHINDLAEVVARLLMKPSSDRRCIDVVGATQVDYRNMLATYRAAMKLPPAMSIKIPAVLIRAAAAIGTCLRDRCSRATPGPCSIVGTPHRTRQSRRCSSAHRWASGSSSERMRQRGSRKRLRRGGPRFSGARFPSCGSGRL